MCEIGVRYKDTGYRLQAKTMIQLKNIERSYKTGAGQTWVLRRVNLEIKEGEFLTIMGPSGAGKSSLLNVLALLDDQWIGEYWFKDEAMHTHESPPARRPGQAHTSVWSSRATTCSTTSPSRRTSTSLSPIRTCPRAQRQGLVADTLDRFSIVGKKDLFPSQLSGGQQQLVGVARAVIHKPALLLADEPTGNLHSSQAKEIMELFKELNQQGTTIVQVTHSEVNAGYGSRVIELRDGWLTADSCQSEPRRGGHRIVTGSPWHRRLSASALALCGFFAAPLVAQNPATPQPPPATDQSTPVAPTPATTPAPAPTPTLAQQAQQIQLQSIGPQQPFHVEMPQVASQSILPLPPSKAPSLDLHNSPRLENLIRDGKLYISLQDAIALAIENNLDLAYSRYTLPTGARPISPHQGRQRRPGRQHPASPSQPGRLQRFLRRRWWRGLSSGAGLLARAVIVTSTLGEGTYVHSFDPVFDSRARSITPKPRR